MTTENRFNLIDEPWIPIADVGRVSLKQVFTDANYRALGGNPVQKVALTKLLLAIAQAAWTPKDDEEWAGMGAEGMARKCTAYLEQWRDRFWLYGDRPFLQMPGIAAASVQSFGAVLPEIATGNTTVLLQSHVERSYSDYEQALLIVVLMGFGLGGKKADNNVVLSAGYSGKSNDKGKAGTAKPGAAVGFMGFMHNFLLAETTQQTLWLNLLTQENIDSLGVYPQGVGVAPWECMPKGEFCSVAQSLRQSLMGRLIPLSRYCLLTDQGLHYSEGIAHLGYKDGVVDPTVAVNYSGKDPKVLWIDPEKRPWRQLTALLSFMNQSAQSGFDCYQIRMGFSRARKVLSGFGIWSGGLRLSSNAGEQYVSGSDDFVESSIFLNSEWVGEWWFERLQREMIGLDTLAKAVYGATMAFGKDQKMEGKDQAAMASNLFWQYCEQQFQNLVNACGDEYSSERKMSSMHKTFGYFAQKSYDSYCPKDTARQLDAWAKNRPNFNKYLSQGR